jgi:hypothetical protein
MKMILEPLRTTRLTNLGFGQLIRRHLSDLSTVDPTLLTDEHYNNYVLKLNGQADIYDNALAEVQENLETQKIMLADEDRDKALSAFGRSVKLFALSDMPSEAEASRGLGILLDNFQNLAAKNYEEETLGIDKLVSDLNGSPYVEKVNLLNLSRYVDRMTQTNNIFKILFGGRMVTTANTLSYDMKLVRAESTELYNDFAEYVLAMAKISDNTLFTDALNLLNTARKYYADQLAHHLSVIAEEEKAPG